MAYAVEISRCPLETLFALQGERAEVAGVLEGLALPDRPNSTITTRGTTLFWIGRTRWLLRAAIDREAELEQKLAGRAVRVSDHYQGFDIHGAEVGEVLAQATPLDLHPARFPPESATFTEFFGQTALISAEREGSFAVYVERSYGDYIDAWLRAAAGF